jgi:site-specific recombinase
MCCDERRRRSYLPLVVGIGGDVCIVIGQLLESHYAIQNAFCAGCTPGSASGYSEYTTYYQGGLFLFILGIVAIVVAIGLAVVYRRDGLIVTKNTSLPRPQIRTGASDEPK